MTTEQLRDQFLPRAGICLGRCFRSWRSIRGLPAGGYMRSTKAPGQKLPPAMNWISHSRQSENNVRKPLEYRCTAFQNNSPDPGGHREKGQKRGKPQRCAVESERQNSRRMDRSGCQQVQSGEQVGDDLLQRDERHRLVFRNAVYAASKGAGHTNLGGLAHASLVTKTRGKAVESTELFTRIRQDRRRCAGTIPAFGRHRAVVWATP